MSKPGSASGSFTTFGEMLKVLRRRAHLTQRDLGIAVGYSETYITRLESNERHPDVATVRARFIAALNLTHEPELAHRFFELAEQAAVHVSPISHTILAQPTTNLPASLTHFIGRENELREVEYLLTTTRLLTLTGSGGVGKTRLALEVGAVLNAATAYADGVWLVELAPLADATRLPHTVAAMFGLRTMSRPVQTVLTDYLVDRQVLLILDNCEHLIGACAELTELLLHACPRLHILTTSREALNILGEVTWRVPPLAVDEAMQLFAERASAVKPGFTVTSDNREHVAHICRRLDDMPLAIELAAVRVRAFSVEELAARMDDVFHLLTGGSRTALPRHQTLRATIDWSYSLLSEPERALLRKLTVFAGGWTLEAAEEMNDDAETSALLVHLVEKSLVVLDEGDAGTRYRLLQTIRQYALEKLAEAGEVTQTRQRHLEVFTRLAEAAGLHLGDAAQVLWLDRLEAELDNIRSALEWTAHRNDTRAGERLIDGIWWFWFLRAHLNEAIKWISEIMLADHVVDTDIRVRANTWLAWLGTHKGDITKSRVWIDAAAAQVRKLGDTSLLNLVLCGQGLLAMNFQVATRSLDEAIQIAQQSGCKREEARALWVLGARMRREGDPRRAEEVLTRGLALAREVGDRYFCSQILLKLGVRALDRADYERARALLEESVTFSRELGAPVAIADSLIDLGTLGVRQRDFDLARPAIKECLGTYAKTDNVNRLAQCVSMAAGIASALGHIDVAARLLAAVATARGNAPRRMEYNSTMYEEYDRLLPYVCAELDPVAFERAWAAGQRMTLNQAIQEALAV